MHRGPTRENIAAAITDALEHAQARIDDAYWHFTRCAGARPPSLVVPEAYAERARLQPRLAALRPQRERPRGCRR